MAGGRQAVRDARWIATAQGDLSSTAHCGSDG
jgi:hypothetical protein